MMVDRQWWVAHTYMYVSFACLKSGWSMVGPNRTKFFGAKSDDANCWELMK